MVKRSGIMLLVVAAGWRPAVPLTNARRIGLDG